MGVKVGFNGVCGVTIVEYPITVLNDIGQTEESKRASPLVEAFVAYKTLERRGEISLGKGGRRRP
jgi:hypothetical protein